MLGFIALNYFVTFFVPRRTLVMDNVTSRKDFRWLQCMRFYFTHPTAGGPVTPQGSLKVCMADASFDYGFEYLGEANF